MDHKNEEWNIVGDSQPLWKAIQDNSIVLNNLYKLIQKIERQQETQAQKLEELQKTTVELQDKMYQNLKNIDDNIKEIDVDIEDLNPYDLFVSASYCLMNGFDLNNPANAKKAVDNSQSPPFDYNALRTLMYFN